MKIWRVAGVAAVAGLVCVAVLGSAYGANSGPLTEQQWFDSSRQHNDEALAALWPVLKSAGKVGRVYFRAYCPPGKYEPVVVFPKLAVVLVPKGTSGVAAVRALFGRNKNITVAEHPAGIIRVTIGAVSGVILRTQIPRLAFDPVAQYNDPFAINAIVGSDAVSAAMSEMKIRAPNRPFGIPITLPDEKLPHLPAVIANVTMDQAFDEVAKTFHTIVLYGECKNSSLFEVSTWQEVDVEELIRQESGQHGR